MYRKSDTFNLSAYKSIPDYIKSKGLVIVLYENC